MNKEKLIEEIKGWFHHHELKRLHQVLMEAGLMSCYDLADVVKEMMENEY